jgi:hypothetical protein
MICVLKLFHTIQQILSTFDSSSKSHMRFTRALIFAFFLIVEQTAAQKVITTYHKDSTVVITRDQRIDQLIARQKDNNTVKQSMSGYRVQIYFGGVRQKAGELKNDFSSKHPEVPAYVSYSAPNFKLRVGDFRTRLEAQKFMKTIEGQYATTFIVQDDVKLPQLK